MTNTCQHDECERKATAAPKFIVPAKYVALDAHNPASALLGLKLCKDHFDELKIEDFLNDDFRESMTEALKGKYPPDFDRAFFKKVKLDSFEYIEFENFRNRGNA